MAIALEKPHLAPEILFVGPGNGDHAHGHVLPTDLDDDDLEVHGNRQDPPEDLADRPLLVEDGDDDREARAAGQRYVSASDG